MSDDSQKKQHGHCGTRTGRGQQKMQRSEEWYKFPMPIRISPGLAANHPRRQRQRDGRLFSRLLPKLGIQTCGMTTQANAQQVQGQGQWTLVPGLGVHYCHLCRHIRSGTGLIDEQPAKEIVSGAVGDRDGSWGSRKLDGAQDMDWTCNAAPREHDRGVSDCHEARVTAEKGKRHALERHRGRSKTQHGRIETRPWGRWDVSNCGHGPMARERAARRGSREITCSLLVFLLTTSTMLLYSRLNRMMKLSWARRSIKSLLTAAEDRFRSCNKAV
ncbi:hypothetical protein V8F06_013175 [Rhypophila decipiens]